MSSGTIGPPYRHSRKRAAFPLGMALLGSLIGVTDDAYSQNWIQSPSVGRGGPHAHQFVLPPTARQLADGLATDSFDAPGVGRIRGLLRGSSPESANLARQAVVLAYELGDEKTRSIPVVLMMSSKADLFREFLFKTIEESPKPYDLHSEWQALASQEMPIEDLGRLIEAYQRAIELRPPSICGTGQLGLETLATSIQTVGPESYPALLDLIETDSRVAEFLGGSLPMHLSCATGHPMGTAEAIEQLKLSAPYTSTHVRYSLSDIMRSLLRQLKETPADTRQSIEVADMLNRLADDRGAGVEFRAWALCGIALLAVQVDELRESAKIKLVQYQDVWSNSGYNAKVIIESIERMESDDPLAKQGRKVNTVDASGRRSFHYEPREY